MQPGTSGESLGSSFRLLVAAAFVACALGAAGALFLLAGGALLDGVIAAAITYFVFRACWGASRRKRELLRRGYFAGHRVGTRWLYEELRGREIVAVELALEYVGSGEYEVHVPSERDWMATMPAWARERRAEIVERLGTVFKRSQMHFDPDTTA
jgi:hypothetical protein